MTLSRLLRATVRILVIPAALATAPDLAASDPDRLGDIARARMEADGVPGVVIMQLAGGAPIWTGAFGMADPAVGQAMTADALSRVEAISKPVTAWGASQDRKDLLLAELRSLHRPVPINGRTLPSARVIHPNRRDRLRAPESAVDSSC
jgi:hypothetical protein